MANKILILGASSDLGRRLSKRFDQNQVIATYCNTPIDDGVFFDALKMKLDDVIRDPEGISHAFVLIAESNPNKCAEDLSASNALNIDAVKRVIDQINKWKILPIFTSTEVVFDGSAAPYVEDDEARPIMTYGRQKLVIEDYIKSVCDHFVILRLSRMYGDAPGDGTLFMDWLQSLESENSIECAEDQLFSPIFIEDVVNACQASVERNLSGTYHVGGPNGMSRLEMLRCLAGAVDKFLPVKASISPCGINDFVFLEDRPRDVSLNSDRICQEAGLVFSAVEDMCAIFAQSIYGSADIELQQ